ncbi:MAG: DNA polymerase III subunit beta [Propionibacteriaceae bacterium]|nr:DNA polymerase III subunit beta [Propionibacteriaceae bacterium]
MKIRIDSAVLADAVAWVARSLPNRPSVPILGGLLVEAGGDAVVLSAFDYETSARMTVPAEVFDEGVALVSGKMFADIARSLPSGPVTISTEETHTELVCGSARFTLQMLPVADYPELPVMPTQTGVVPSDDFARAVAQVFVAAGRDELLAIYTGVRVEIEGDTISLLATDRYRMALKELKWNPADAKAEGAAIVPGRVLNEAARSMASGETISLSLSGTDLGDGLIGFSGQAADGTRQLTTRLLGGEFPKFRHLLDVKANLSVRLKTDDLVAAVRRVALVAERNTPMRMVINEDGVVLDAATGDQAQASEALEAVVTNYVGTEAEMTAVGFNPHYLADALGALDAPYTHFSFTAPGQPCLVQGVDDADGEPRADYRHVIMLMRLPG